MRSRLLVATAAALAIFAACGDDSNSNKDAGPHDGGVDAPPDGPGTQETTCETLPPLASGTCAVSGVGDIKLLKGTVLTPTTIFHGGQVAIDTTGQITCAGCNCAVGGETVITCPDAAISPGLINTHDHITFTQNNPYTDSGDRYDDRQQWRKGLDSHAKIPSSGGASAAQIRWGELRFLMGGATSIVGSGGQTGLLRNLDIAADQEGLGKPAVDFDTFPLDDSSATRRTADCNYGGTATTAASLANIAAYEPHTAEGIDTTAHNEFLCQSSTTYDVMAPGVSDNLLLSKTAMIHGIGLTANDYGAMATAGTGLIWSPRSNITLYGDTARVSTAGRMGVNIALGTDWMPTGSMNLLRELKCADSFNATYMNHYFSDTQLWEMVTSNAASITKTDDKLGLLAQGHVADITIFRGNGHASFRSVIDAKPEDVALVMRGGKIMYGDDALVTSLATNCDAVSVCATDKRVCLMDDIGMTLAQLTTAAGSIYPAFQCDVPMNEPTCTPKRPNAVMGSTVYTGMSSATDSDGDGIADTDDNCPNVFNPVRPMDGGMQADADGDGVGDSCDPCPLDANTSTCTTANPDDRDHDGVPNATDNCPDNANMDQLDTDMDGKGDACDACPNDKNEGTAGCPSTIYQIKTNHWPIATHVVVTNAIVTGKASNGFFAQVKLGDTGYVDENNSGVFVFTGAAAPTLANATVNRRVTIEASVDNFAGEIELDNVTTVTATTSVDEAAPAPITVAYTDIVTGGPRAAALEGVIVSLPGAAVSAVNATAGEFTLTASASTLIVDDLLLTFTNPSVGQTFTAVTGVLALRSAASKLEPRTAGDLSQGAPALASLDPALSYVRVNQTLVHTFPVGDELTVRLTGPAQGATTVHIASSDPGLTIANNGDVVVANNATTAQVQVSAGTTAVADVTLTATLLSGPPQTAHVRVLGAAEAATTVTLAPTTSAVAAHGTVQLAVSLDIPPATDTVVNLSVAPANGTLPATVTVLANQLTTSFTYTDTAGAGDATITASFAASTATATVTVNTGANHLVINEVDYDQPMSDTAEFIEIYNPSATAQSLAGKALMLVNGSDSTVYSTIDLSPATSIPSHGYLVIAGDTVTVTTSATVAKFQPATWKVQDNVQNGAPDGIALVDTTTSTLIDALSYEGSITAAMLTGFANPVSLVEGTALATATADSNTVAGSLCRTPDGQDTDVASADWKLCTTITPGAANGN